MAFTYCTNCGEKIDDSLEKCPHCNHPKGVDRVYGYASENYGKSNTPDGQNAQGGNAQNGNPWDSNQGQDEQNGRQGNPWEDNRNQGEQNPWNTQNGGQGNPWNGNRSGRNPWESGGQNGNNPYGQQPPYGQNGNNPYGQNGQNPYGQGGPWQGPYGRNGDPYGRPPYNGGFGGYQPWQPREKRKPSIGLIIFSVINILLGSCCAGSIFGIIGLIFAITARDAATEEEEIRRKKISLAINIIAVILTVVFIISFAVGFMQSGGMGAILQQ